MCAELRLQRSKAPHMKLTRNCTNFYIISISTMLLIRLCVKILIILLRQLRICQFFTSPLMAQLIHSQLIQLAYIVYQSVHLFSTLLVISGIVCIFFSNLFGNVYFVVIKFYVKTYQLCYLPFQLVPSFTLFQQVNYTSWRLIRNCMEQIVVIAWLPLLLTIRT